MAGSRKLPPLLPELQRIESCVTAALQPFAGRRCVVGLSGGLDSVVLLDLLARIAPRFALQLSALHVNHQISPNADNWQQFCQQLAHVYSIPLQVRRVQLRRSGGESLEAVARTARYAAYHAADADLILLAHHLDDQCETMLLRLLRGAGTHGLAAMPDSRPLDHADKLLLRPLLQIPREQLKTYAHAAGLRWIDDESNDDTRYRRNWLRHELLPRIEQVFPAYRRQLRQAAQHSRESADLLDELAAQDFHGELAEGWLELAALLPLSPARQRNLLRWFLRQRDVTPSAAVLEQLQQQMLQARVDAEPQIRIGGWLAERYRERMYLRRMAVEPRCPPQTGIDLLGRTEAVFPEWQGRLVMTARVGQGVGLRWLSAHRLDMRKRVGGERLRPILGGAQRQLKHLLQEAAIPPWRRNTLPLLWIGDRLVAVPGVTVAAEFQASAGEDGVQICWQHDPDQYVAAQ